MVDFQVVVEANEVVVVVEVDKEGGLEEREKEKEEEKKRKNEFKIKPRRIGGGVVMPRNRHISFRYRL